MSLCSFPLFSRLPFTRCSISAFTHSARMPVYTSSAAGAERGDAGQRGGRGPCSFTPDLPRTCTVAECIGTSIFGTLFPGYASRCSAARERRPNSVCRNITATAARRRRTSIPTLTPRRPRTMITNRMEQMQAAAAKMMLQRSRKGNRATRADARARSTDTVTGQPRATGLAPPALTRAATAMQVTAMIVTARGRNATAAGTNGIARAE